MKVSKAKYELAMARANKKAKDIVKAGISASTLTDIWKRDVRPVTVSRLAKAIGCFYCNFYHPQYNGRHNKHYWTSR